MTTLAPPPAVVEYADAVRAHLAGLDAETLDELTGGLEADLAEALAERLPDGGAADLSAVTGLFGPPSSYAEELSAAAGVELPTTDLPRPPLSARLARRAVAAVGRWRRWRARHRWVGEVVTFLVALRPVWWVARGWVLFHLVTAVQQPVLGTGLARFVLLGSVVLSVLWGQRRVGQQRWWRRLGLLASVVAVVAALPVVSVLYGRITWQPSTAGWQEGYHAGYAEGSNDGRRQAMAWYGDSGTLLAGPTNLFVYGPDGEPVVGAQVLDERGEPVVLVEPETGISWDRWDPATWDHRTPVPLPVLEGTAGNVYPWAYVPAEQLRWGPDGAVSGDAADAEDPRWPAESLDPVLGSEPVDDPSTD